MPALRPSGKSSKEPDRRDLGRSSKRWLTNPRAIHVWLLDDLTCLISFEAARREEASRLLRLLRDAAQARAVRLYLVASSRQKPPADIAGIEVEALGPGEAVELARRIVSEQQAAAPTFAFDRRPIRKT